MSERLVVFDIELLNKDESSVCSIGIVEMVDFKIVSTYYSLIRPWSMVYDRVCYSIHHISVNELKKERTFKEIWPEIRHYFEESIVVAHDINTDMIHLRATMKQQGIEYPHLYMSCTNMLAHLIYPEKEKYNLSELAAMHNVTFKAHHALEDAKMCAYILKKMVEKDGSETLRDLHMKHHMAFGEMKHNYYRNVISAESVVNLERLPDHKNELYHNIVCFTGKLSVPKEELEEKTRQASALPVQQVTTQTNILVVGENGFYKVRYGNKNKKVLKALKLIKQGQDLKIIKENDYLKLLEQQ